MHTVICNKQYRSTLPGPGKFPLRHKSSVLCKSAGCPNPTSHNLSESKFLLEADKKYMARCRLVADAEEDIDQHHEEVEDSGGGDDFQHDSEMPSGLLDSYKYPQGRCSTITLPECFHPAKLMLDMGATTNMIKDSVVKAIKLPVKPASH